MFIYSVALKIPRALVAEIRLFYTQKLQLKEIADMQFQPHTAEEMTKIKFIIDEKVVSSEAHSMSIFWKVGLALDDVDSFCKDFFPTKTGKQFLDVGYLTHVQDPAGFTIELLQTTFETSSKDREALLKKRPKNQPRAIGQISLRVRDIQATIAFYCDLLGMSLVCLQPIPQFHFTLYFFAFTRAEPPNPNNLQAVENREWLYQQSFTTIEVQHRQNDHPRTTLSNSLLLLPHNFECISIGLHPQFFASLCTKMNVSATVSLDETIVLHDPDGLPLHFSCISPESTLRID